MKIPWTGWRRKRAAGISLSAMADDFARGRVRCAGCRRQVEWAGLPPLTLQPCPRCGALLFVPGEIGNWCVLNPLGSGGMGRVYVGCAKADARTKVCLKILGLFEPASDDSAAGLLREAETGMAFGAHPNLVRVYDCGRLEGGAFLVMDLIEGLSWRDRIERTGGRGLPAESTVFVVLDLLDALEHVHACGYVYRDLNPGNVVVQADGMARLVDYGICMTCEAAWDEREGPIVGTPLYLPPERCLRQGEDFRSDLYALGMVFYHALTGAPFFTARTVAQAVEGHMRMLRTCTASKMPGCHARLVAVVDRMIRRDPEERYRSFEEIRTDLHAFLREAANGKAPDAVVAARRQAWRERAAP